MQDVLLYLFKVNVILTITYLGYFLLLKNLTFYKLNRTYFMISMLLALFYPVIPLHEWVSSKAVMIPAEYVEYLFVYEPQESFSLSWLHVVAAVVLIGALVLLVKIIIQLCSIFRIHLHSTADRWRNFIFRKVDFAIVPFSFFDQIYLFRGQKTDLELESIFKHEEIHVRGWHSIDILLTEFILLASWFNPFIWFLRKAVRQNLEFLTDQEVLDEGVDRQHYQYSLLHVARDGASIEISNHFNFKILKKRMMMMNKKRSSRVELGKYVFLLPVVIFFGASFTVTKSTAKMEKMVTELSEKAVDLPLAEKLIKSDLLPQTEGVTTSIPSKKVQAPSGFLPVAKDTIVPSRNTVKGDNVVYVVDGKKVEPNVFRALNPDHIQSINVLKGGNAMAVYGAAAANGVVEITLKKEEDLSSSKNNVIVVRGIQGKSKDSVASTSYRSQVFVVGQKIDSAAVKGAGYVTYNKFTPSENQHSTKTITIRGRKKINASDVLILLDGKEIDDKTLNDFGPDEIESIEVLKGDKIESKYGDKAKNGVVLITSKK